VKKQIKNSFNSLHSKRGSYSAVLIMALIAIIIVVNLVVNQIPTKFTQLDMSSNKYYSIGTETKNLVKSLKQDVNIYQIAATDDKDTITTKLLGKYEEMSDHIHVSTIDPELNPSFVQQYSQTDLDSNSLIVESGTRFKIINASDIYESTYDESYYTTGQASSTSYDGEGEITSAIDYVTTEDIPVFYTMYGEGEQELSSTVEESIKKENFEINKFSMLESGSVPEDCDVMAIIAPAYDLSADTAAKVISYLQSGGKAIIVSNYTGTDMPNFNSVLEAYGMQLAKGYVVEGNQSNYYQNQLNLLPIVGSHDITDSIANQNLYILVKNTQAILQMDDIRSTLSFTDLLTTSSDAYTLTDYGQGGTLTKTSDSASGPFSVAKAVTEDVGDQTTKLVVLASYYTLTDSITSLTPANITLFVNSLNWMCDHESTINISAKSLDVEYNTVSTAATNAWTGIFMIIIPLAVIIIGLFVWIRRRKA
jgi:ABC-2 type transport system permease protein